MPSSARLAALLLCLGCASAFAQEAAKPYEPPILVPSPVPRRIEFVLKPPDVVMENPPEQFGSLLRYDKVRPWEGTVHISDRMTRRGFRDDKEIAREEEFNHEIRLAVRLETRGPEGQTEGFILHVQPLELPLVSIMKNDNAKSREEARDALLKVRLSLWFSSRGALERCEFDLPENLSTDGEWHLRRLEELLPLLVPPLPADRIRGGAWTSTQTIASDLISKSHRRYRYCPQHIDPGAVFLQVEGWQKIDGPINESVPRLRTPAGFDDEPRFRSDECMGFLRVDLGCAITRYGVYSSSKPHIGKFPPGLSESFDRDIVIRAEPSPSPAPSPRGGIRGRNRDAGTQPTPPSIPR